MIAIDDHSDEVRMDKNARIANSIYLCSIKRMKRTEIRHELSGNIFAQLFAVADVIRTHTEYLILSKHFVESRAAYTFKYYLFESHSTIHISHPLVRFLTSVTETIASKCCVAL